MRRRPPSPLRLAGEVGRGFLAQARLLARPRYLLMTALLLAMSWLAMEVYHNQAIRGLPVLVIDRDNSKISRTIRSFLHACPEIDTLDQPDATREEGQRLLAAGRIAGLVYLPENLSSEIKQGRRGTALIELDMSNIVMGKNAYKAVSQVLTTVAVGTQMTVVRKLGENKSRAMAKVLPIRVSESFAYNPATNYGIYVMPGLIFFFLHVYVLILGVTAYLPIHPADDWKKRLGAFLAILPAGMLLGLTFFYGFLPYENLAPASGPGVAVVALAAFIVLDLLMAAAFNAVIPRPIFAFEATVVVGMLSLMFSGITWPPDAFPAAIRLIGAWIPFTAFAQGFQAFIHAPTRLSELGFMFHALGRQALLFGGVIAAGAAARRIIVAARRA